MRRWSPYNYAFDNPIRFIDPDGMKSTDWIKNNITGNYLWEDEVTSEANTPKGYTYVGNSESDIIKDLGFKPYLKTTSTVVGLLASDSEENSQASYSANHLVKASITTDVRITADVVFPDGALSKLLDNLKGLDLI